MLVEISSSNLMSLVQRPGYKNKKKMEKGSGSEFVLAEHVQTAGPNNYDTITKLLDENSVDICILLSKANIAF